MFTGLVETTGIVTFLNHTPEGSVIGISNAIVQTMHIGDSLAINGVCLTITRLENTTAYVQIVPETLRVTTLATLHVGKTVNLERALLANGRLGGHFVLGHVDTTASIVDAAIDGVARTLRFSLAQNNLPYVVPKGQIALDGMSLTIVAVYDDSFSVTFIPHTQAITIAGNYYKGDKVNVEFDILAKYARRSMCYE
ncbi:MAG: riboflavin synthase [Gammaproteobacteria bacterium]|nr:riboflavin synthase [Gammaproteobacteria bacterium]